MRTGSLAILLGEAGHTVGDAMTPPWPSATFDVVLSRLLELVHAHGRKASITPLPDANLWGGPVTDDRYLLVSPP
ncbi:MAG: hypothetical protein ACXVTC_13330 [Solirubrobacteraceae bacterium]